MVARLLYFAAVPASAIYTVTIHPASLEFRIRVVDASSYSTPAVTLLTIRLSPGVVADASLFLFNLHI